MQAARAAFSGANTRHGIAPPAATYLPARPVAAAGCSSSSRRAAPQASRASRQQQRQQKRGQQGAATRRAAVCQATQADAAATVPDGSVSLVLLAGGVGKRMGAAIPKQYLELNGQPIATYSMQTFAAMPQIGEIVVVCEPEWRDVFQQCYDRLPRQVPLKFAQPGGERQDSVLSGFQAIDAAAQLVAIHDSARPLVTPKDALQCFVDAWQVGAAVLGVPVKPTIKEVDADRMVVQTLKRAALWEVQTPQVIRPALLREGFELVARQGLEVTDDVSIIEALGRPVFITAGSYTNIKVTTPDDMSVAERFLEEAAEKPVVAAA